MKVDRLEIQENITPKQEYSLPYRGDQLRRGLVWYQSRFPSPPTFCFHWFPFTLSLFVLDFSLCIFSLFSSIEEESFYIGRIEAQRGNQETAKRGDNVSSVAATRPWTEETISSLSCHDRAAQWLLCSVLALEKLRKGNLAAFGP